MNNYLLLYSGGSMPASEAEQKAVMDDWMAWFGMHGSAIVDQGGRLSQASKTHETVAANTQGDRHGLFFPPRGERSGDG